jgi:hypothetical protein
MKEGAIVRKVGSSSPLDGDFMHSKFIIIDDLHAWGGSYNFTNNARSNYESFKKWDGCEVNQTVKEFNTWMNNAIGIFDGISDVENVLKRLKEKFLEEQKKNHKLLHSISSLDFSEHEYIQKREEELPSYQPHTSLHSHSNQNEEKENSLRNALGSLSEKKSGITTNGTVAVSSGMLVKNHSFYGGSAYRNIVQKRKNHYALLWLQKLCIEKYFHCFKTRIANGMLVCTGELRPTGECDKYKLRIEYIPGLHPMVYIKSPQIPQTGEIHIYREGFLCLFNPAETSWKDTNKLTEYTIPWAIEWIICYELWKITGKWEGKESSH